MLVSVIHWYSHLLRNKNLTVKLQTIKTSNKTRCGILKVMLNSTKPYWPTNSQSARLIPRYLSIPLAFSTWAHSQRWKTLALAKAKRSRNTGIFIIKCFPAAAKMFLTDTKLSATVNRCCSWRFHTSAGLLTCTFCFIRLITVQVKSRNLNCWVIN